MPLQEGKPIWVESLMTPSEWYKRHKEYPTTSRLLEPPLEFNGDFKWRKGMGAGLSEVEIEVINERLKAVRKLVNNVV